MRLSNTAPFHSCRTLKNRMSVDETLAADIGASPALSARHAQRRRKESVLSGLGWNTRWPWSWLLFAVAAVAAYWESSRATALWDVSYVLEIAYRITLGLAPYRDFVVPQAPLTFLIQAAAMRMFDVGYVVQRIYCAVGAGAVAWLTFHVIRTLMLPQFGVRAPVYAFIIAIPSVFLSGYVIIPWPWYDSDAALLTLLALAAMLFARRPGARVQWLALAGALVILPALAKQNIGLAFAFLMHASVLASAVGRPSAVAWQRYRVFLGGFLASALVIAVCLHLSSGLPNMYRWTVIYAAARRGPGIMTFVSPYLRLDTWLVVAVTLAGYVLYVFAPGRRSRLAALMLALAPWAYVARDIVWWSLSHRAHCLWGLGTLVAGPVALLEWFRDRWSFERAVPLIALGVAHAAFASHGLGGSAFSVWPLLLIGMAPLARRILLAGPEHSRHGVAYIAIMSIGLTCVGFLHVARNEQLQYVDLSGVAQVSSLRTIRGLVAPGAHLSDFERLIARTDQLIPSGAGVLALPGEDPFYVASGRRPRLPIVLFDNTAMPGDANDLSAMLDRHAIDWVIVKDRQQLRSQVWDHADTFLTDHLPKRYELVETLPRYRIFRRRATVLSARH
jgi:hypothetical protein